MSSGLYDKLVKLQYLVSHKEKPVTQFPNNKRAWKILYPQQIPFISYPYEWSFTMLKDAALLTLQIQKLALEHGMSLKDASSFNIQFFDGKPIFIDTLSFEKYQENKPWVAYKQFIEHFLSPLYISAMTDIRLNRLSALFIDGIPVELASKLLPFKSRMNISLLLHIHVHASTQKKYSDKKLDSHVKNKPFSKNSLLGMLNNLEGAIKSVSWNPQGTQWAEYYEEDNNNYKSDSLSHKAKLTKEFLQIIKPKLVWDMGANTGYFSAVASNLGASVVSFDNDYGALEKHYRELSKIKNNDILPLFCDLTNPTPALGFANSERMSLEERGPADTLLALALIHHLTISHNIPFSHLASYFSKLGNSLIIEFIEKEDSQIQKLLANREDIFVDYTKDNFEKSFAEYFTIVKTAPIKNSKRTLYLMKKKIK